ncbi:MAG: class I SAM-dependent methyltransferase [Ferruginibacter sp.]
MAFSSDEMYTGGAYFMNNPCWDDDYTQWKAGIIHSLLRKNNVYPKTVVDVGCGAGGILLHLSEKDNNIEKLEGYDISPDAIRLAAKKSNEKLTFHLEDYTSKPHSSPDLLLCIDVLEHIDNVYGFLGQLKKTSGHTIFHIPLDVSCRTILKPHVILQQRNAVGHIHYFSQEMAMWALSDSGFRIIDWVYTKPAVDWEPADSFKRNLKKTLRNFSFAINKNLSAKLWGGYSMMILAEG